MKTFTRRTGWLIGSVMSVALAVVSLRAADEWVSRDALGDLLVAQTNQILVYGNDGTPKTPAIPVMGDNREIAFDIDLNAYVANVFDDGDPNTPLGRIVRIPAGAHSADDPLQYIPVTSSLVNPADYEPDEPTPRSVAFDRLQYLWVGLDNAKPMPGNKNVGVIQRYEKVSGAYVFKDEFSVQSDGGFASLDVVVDPTGTPVVIYTTRGKSVWRLDTTKATDKPLLNSSAVKTFTGAGEGAEVRILHPGIAQGDYTGGALVAFGNNFRFLSSLTSSASVRTCDVWTSGNVQRIHAELDFDPRYWWGGADNGEWKKLDFTNGCPAHDTIDTGAATGGGTINGTLKVGTNLSYMTFPKGQLTTQRIEFLDSRPPTEGGFNQAGGYAHGITETVNNTSTSDVTVAAWFAEVLSDKTCDPPPPPGELDPQFKVADFDCRSVKKFGKPPGSSSDLPYAVQGTSRTREHYTWIHEITKPESSGLLFNLSFIYFPDPLQSRPPCPTGEARATWLLKDAGADLHPAAGGANAVTLNSWDENVLGAFFPDDTTGTRSTRGGSQYAAVYGCAANDGVFDAIGNPQNLKSTLTLSFTVRSVATDAYQPNLEDFLNLTVTATDPKGTPVGDRLGLSLRFLSANGILLITEQESVERYKINLYLDPKIFGQYLDPNTKTATFIATVNSIDPAIQVQEFFTTFVVKGK